MFRELRRTIGVSFVTALAAGMLGTSAFAQTPPDNTKANKSNRGLNADQQKNNRSDLETTRQIRRAIVADKTLSSAAHNVKVITQGGKVTLKGPVRTPEEKQRIEEKATEIAGASNVTDRLTVKEPSSRKSK
jgi:hyperosmotically inducible protein